jgi:AmmeMemoRadiSam system protein B/AmmeMemoRadiSam system protein A
MITMTIPTAFACGATGDRTPAVAGQFYPGDKSSLAATVDKLFQGEHIRKTAKTPMALIVPHAGYTYSGGVAASGFLQLDPNSEFDNIFLLGASHHAAFEGASVYASGDFLTPLGKVPVNRELAKSLMHSSPVFLDREDAHLEEHSLEVQLPFLQRRLKHPFRIVPIILGTQSPETCAKIAEVLKPYFTPRNLFVISTDFSHYPRYADAVAADRVTADAVVTNKPDRLIAALVANDRKGVPNLLTSMCGWPAVYTLLKITEGDRTLHYQKILYRNSGDAKGGDSSQVVGYCSIAVTKEAPSGEFQLTPRERRELLAIARQAVEDQVRTGRVSEVAPEKLTPALRTPCGAFVTLKKHGDLRGCIGRFDADEPLYSVVQQMAVAAATQDYRFPPVQQGELKSLEFEISVLTPLRRISSPEEIEMGKHGIYIRKGNHSGTFLPQVAQETGWSRDEFLGHCAQDKAGLGWDGWKDAELSVYEAIVFSEKEQS